MDIYVHYMDIYGQYMDIYEHYMDILYGHITWILYGIILSYLAAICHIFISCDMILYASFHSHSYSVCLARLTIVFGLFMN